MNINNLEYFLIKCGGGDIDFLDEQNIQPDINKQVGIGGAVLLTGILASLTFGYAMSWVFNKPAICVFVGIIWGLLIFNLDRLIVGGSIKTSKNAISYYSTTFFRMFLAVGIAFTISIPIELKLFETKLVKETAKLEILGSTRLKDLRAEQQNQRAKAELEVAGQGKTGKKGDGIVTKFLNKESLRIDNQIAEETKKIETGYLQNSDKLGLLERFKALESLKEDPDVRKISIGITLLFMLIELIPVLVKTFSTDAVYEDKIRVQIRNEQQKLNIQTIQIDKTDKVIGQPLKFDDGIESKKPSRFEEIFHEKIWSLGISFLVAVFLYPFVNDMTYTSATGFFVFLFYKPLANAITGNEN